MISDMCQLQQTLLSLESTLRIEYNDKDVPRTVRRAVSQLENAYQCKLDKPVYVVQAQNELVSENLNVFLLEVAEALKQLALLNSVVLFTKKPPILLADVNYMGFTADTLTTALKYLQDIIYYEKRENIIRAMESALNHMEMTQIKRLCIILLVMERLGIFEGVSLCAQLLYLGGIAL